MIHYRDFFVRNRKQKEHKVVEREGRLWTLSFAICSRFHLIVRTLHIDIFTPMKQKPKRMKEGR